MKDDRASNRASYLAEPTVVTLVRLLHEIRQGLLAFPRFQRPFVWEPKQRLELLRTVIAGLPIGSILTWRTQREIPTFSELGPWIVPEPAAAGSGRQYILDGLQRLATLFVALSPEKKASRKASSDDDPKEIYVHLVSDPPTVADEGEEVEEDGQAVRVENAKRALPLTIFNDSKLLLKGQRKLQILSDGDTLIERSDRVADVLKNYKVPVVPFVSDDLDDVTRAFQRVNSQGTQMSPLHMVNALAWTERFSLLEELARLKETVLAPHGWQDLDDTVVLRCFAMAVGLEAYEFEVQELADRLRRDHATAVDVVARTLVQISVALRRTCHIRTPELVPYSLQILVLFGAVRDLGRLEARQRRILSDFIWFTSYVEAFSGSTSQSLVTRATTNLAVALRGDDDLVWDHRRTGRRPLPQSFDFRHARARTLALRLAEQYRDQVRTQHRRKGLNAYRFLAEEKTNAVVNIVPPEARGAWALRPGARVVLGSRTDLARLRSPQRGPYDPTVGKRFCISEAAWGHFAAEDYEAFVRQRGEDLERLELDHFNRVRRRLFGGN